MQAERKRLSLTQAKLASAWGISRITLAKYEAGRSAPDIATLARGARTAGLDLEFLVTGSRNQMGPDLGWVLIRGMLGLLRKTLNTRGQEISRIEEAEIVREMYLMVMGTGQPRSEDPIAARKRADSD